MDQEIALETHGNCSPVIARVKGNVSVSCGPADIEVEFLLNSIVQECAAFSEEMSRWGQDILEWKRIRVAYYPNFNRGIVEDIRENKAVIYQYDKQRFLGVYNQTIDIQELRKAALEYRKSFGEFQITANDREYLSAVDNLCFWAGVDIKLGVWISTYDPDGRFIFLPEAKGMLGKYEDRKAIPIEIANNLLGYWCSTDSDTYIAMHSFEEGYVNFEVGKRKNKRFNLLISNPRLARLVDRPGAIGILKDLSASAGLIRGISKPSYTWSIYNYSEDSLHLESIVKLDGVLESPVEVTGARNFQRCKRS